MLSLRSKFTMQLVVLCFLICSAIGFDGKLPQSRRAILNALLNTSTYDPRLTPDYEEDYPTKVVMQINILTVESLNELSMDFSVDMIMRQVWHDDRLDFSSLSNTSRLELDGKSIDMTWVPDLFFSNEKTADIHTVTTPNKLMHILRNGTVIYSFRLGMTLTCQMKLYSYPLDGQKCPIFLESYGYTLNNVEFEWNEQPIIVGHVEMPQFSISTHPTATKCSRRSNEIGDFTCLQAHLYFERNVGYYLIQVFLPSCLIVILSWISFWIDSSAIPARISLGLLTILTMTTQSSGVRSSLPKVSYVKAIDVWMSVCLVFVFASLLEFAYINTLKRKKCPASLKNNPEKGDKDMAEPLQTGQQSIEDNNFDKMAKKIDKVSRVAFPVCFFVFNIVFWSYYLTLNKYD